MMKKIIVSKNNQRADEKSGKFISENRKMIPVKLSDVSIKMTCFKIIL